MYEVDILAVDGWAVTFGTVRRGLGGAAARPDPNVTGCPPINGQCTNHRIVALRFEWTYKWF